MDHSPQTPTRHHRVPQAAASANPNRSDQSPAEQLFTVEDVAGLARVSVKTVRRWLESGGLGSYRLGRSVRISKAHYHDFLVSEGKGAPRSKSHVQIK